MTLFKDFSGDRLRLFELEATKIMNSSLVPENDVIEFVDNLSRLLKVLFRIMSKEYGLTSEQFDALLTLVIIEVRTTKL